MKTLTIAEIAKQVKVHPRVARARIRRALKDKNNKVPAGLKGARWVWPANQAKIIKDYISD